MLNICTMNLIEEEISEKGAIMAKGHLSKD
jgi:hypothetical protein